VKNKCAPPFRTAEFDLMYSKGISKEGSLLDVAVEHGIVRKSGAWFTYNEEQIGQGRENAKAFLTEHKDVASEIEKLIMAQLATPPNGEVPPPSDEPPADDDDDGLSKIKADEVVASLTAKVGAKKK
jgi:recombination protein RecA